jgi:hypothetical protein
MDNAGLSRETSRAPQATPFGILVFSYSRILEFLNSPLPLFPTPHFADIRSEVPYSPTLEIVVFHLTPVFSYGSGCRPVRGVQDQVGLP